MVIRLAPRTHWSRSLAWTLIALVATAITIEGAIPLVTNAQQSTNPTGNQGRQLTLKEQLVTGLRAFTKSDLAFIDEVVVLVHQGLLPRRLVDSTFLWARDRAARRSYTRRLRPMVYFRPALVARAKRAGLRL